MRRAPGHSTSALPRRVATRLAAVILAGLATTAGAQQPSSTTATYEDWVVRCRTVPGTTAAAAATQLCELATLVNAQDQAGQARPIAQVAIGRAPTAAGAAATGPTMVIQVPEGVNLKGEIALVLYGEGDAETGRLGAAYFRCVSGFCLADAALDATQLAQIAAAKTARIAFIDGGQRPVELPISLNGFAPASAAALGGAPG